MVNIKKVTDKGFFLHPTLKDNIDSLIVNAHKDNDFIIIVSGSGETRTGKSTLAQQLGYYIAYNRNAKFTLKNNICFSGKKLIENALKDEKSCYIYDEAREGLQSKKFYDKLNQSLLDFFAEAGQLNHFIILVLPDFFELDRGLAIVRSTILLNVFYTYKKAKVKKGYGDIKTGQEYLKFERGKFDFYNRDHKKIMYIKGKKMHDYNMGAPDFDGEFRDYWLVDKDKYRKLKDDFLRRQRFDVGKSDPHLKQRNALFKILTDSGLSQSQISQLLSKEGIKMDRSTVSLGIKGHIEAVKCEL